MTDRISVEHRSRNMARIKGANTGSELTLRSEPHWSGLRFRAHRAGLPCRLDILLRRFSAVIVVYGCFWHRPPGCPNAKIPKSRQECWVAKFHSNVLRETARIRERVETEWRVLVFWEYALFCGAVVHGTVELSLRRVRGASRYAEILWGPAKSVTPLRRVK